MVYRAVKMKSDSKAIFFWYHTLIYAIVIVSIAGSPLDVFDISVYLACLVIGYLVSLATIGYLNMQTDSYTKNILNLLLMYFTFAYVLKLPYAIYFTDQLWISKGLLSFDENTIREYRMEAFLAFIAGYISIILGFISYYALAKNNKSSQGSFAHKNINYRFIFLLVLILIVYKYYLQHIKHIGVPGMQSEELFIPMLAGISVLLVKTGLFFILNYYLYNALLNNRFRQSAFALLFVFIFIAQDILIGSKHAIIYEIFILSWYVYRLKRVCSPRILFSVIISLVVITVFTALAYKYLNAYRFAVLGGGAGIEAIDLALASKSTEKVFAFELFNRINGLDNIIAALVLVPKNIGVLSALTGGVTESFTGEIFGKEHQGASFGVTQIGMFYVVGGYISVSLGMYFIGLLFSFTANIAYKIVRCGDATKEALLPVLLIIFIKILMNGGNVVLSVKELSVLVICVFFIDSLHRRYIKRTNSRKDYCTV